MSLSDLKKHQRNNSLIYVIFNVFFKPWKGAIQVTKDKTKFKTIALILFFIGLLRGIFETMMVYGLANKINEFYSSLGDLDWYLYNGGPFIISNIITPYFFWLGVSFIVHEEGKFFEGIGKYEDTLRFYGIFMISYLFIIILNFIHLYTNLPFLYYDVSTFYGPYFGVGHISIFIWISIVSFFVFTKQYQLQNLPAMILSISLPLIAMSAYVYSVFITSFVFQQKSLSSYFTMNVSYIFITLLITLILFYLKKEKINH